MSDTMVCPRCSGAMQTFERAGVHVDQCQNCKGIFLDRGGFEQRVNAEQSHYPQETVQMGGYPPPVPGGYPPPQPAGYPPPDYYDERYQGHHGHHDDEHHGHHYEEDEHQGYRRRGLFHNLFED